VVKVGGATEIETKERMERAEDAILATKAALKDGIIPGGEIVYLSLNKVLKPKTEHEEFAYRIIRKALKAPFIRLVENAGLNSGELIAALRVKEFGAGVNVETGKIENMVRSGVIDPARVAIEAFKNAVSVAISMTTSDGVICQIEEEKK
ncbi:hypothetical protein LCGC14_2329660, partial [marine sediment metagenome]